MLSRTLSLSPECRRKSSCLMFCASSSLDWSSPFSSLQSRPLSSSRSPSHSILQAWRSNHMLQQFGGMPLAKTQFERCSQSLCHATLRAQSQKVPPCPVKPCPSKVPLSKRRNTSSSPPSLSTRVQLRHVHPVVSDHFTANHESLSPKYKICCNPSVNFIVHLHHSGFFAEPALPFSQPSTSKLVKSTPYTLGSAIPSLLTGRPFISKAVNISPWMRYNSSTVYHKAF